METLVTWSLSPDGRSIALIERYDSRRIRLLSVENGRWQDLPIKGEPVRVWSVSWTADGRGFFVTSSTTKAYRLAHVDLQGNATVLLENPRIQWLADPVPSPDGRHLAFGSRKWDTNVWLLEGF